MKSRIKKHPNGELSSGSWLILMVVASVAALWGCGGSADTGGPVDESLRQSPRSLLTLGIRELEQENPDRAMELLGEAVRREPDLQEAQYMLGIASYRVGDYGRSVRAFADAALLTPQIPLTPYSTADIHYNIGIVYLEIDRIRTARDHFNQAVTLDPEFGRAWFQLGRLDAMAGALDSAKENLERAVDVDPSLGEGFWLRGRLASRTGNVSSAAWFFRRALERNRGLTATRLDLARGLVQAGDLHESLPVLEALVEEHHDSASAWLLLGDVRRSLELPVLASSAYERCLELEPQSFPCSAGLAYAKTVLGTDSEVSELLTKIRSAEGGESLAGWLEARQAERNGESDKALALYEKHVQSGVGPPESRRDFGLLLLRTGDREAAREQLEAYLKECRIDWSCHGVATLLGDLDSQRAALQ